MSVTVDLKVLAFIVIAIALIVLIVYLIKLAKKLMITLDHTNKILEDTKVITEIAADRSKDVDKIVSDVTEAAASLADAVKGKQNIVSALAAVFKAAAAVKNAVDKEKD